LAFRGVLRSFVALAGLGVVCAPVLAFARNVIREAPHLGHASRRLGLGSGYATDSGYYHLVRFRGAFYDALDPGRGHPAWGSVELLPFTFRYRLEQEKLTLEDAALARLESLRPWTGFEKPLSLRASVGFVRTRDAACHDCPTGLAEVGAGVSFAPFADVLLVYALGEARLLTPFDQGLLDFFRFGVGTLGGLLVHVSPDVALGASGRWTHLPGQEPASTWSVEAALRAQYTHDFALGVEASLHPESRWVQGVSYIYF